MCYNIFNMRQFSKLDLIFLACTISSIQAYLNCNNPNEKDNVLIQNDFLWKKCEDGKVIVEACIIKTFPNVPAEYFTATQLRALYLNISGKAFLEDGDERLYNENEETISSFCAKINQRSQMSSQYFRVVKQLLMHLTQTTATSMPPICQLKKEGDGKIFSIKDKHEWSECEDGEIKLKKCLIHADETSAKCITRNTTKEILQGEEPNDYDFEEGLCSGLNDLLYKRKRAEKAKHLAPNCFDDSASDEVFLYLFGDFSAENLYDKYQMKTNELAPNINLAMHRIPFFDEHKKPVLPIGNPEFYPIPNRRPPVNDDDHNIHVNHIRSFNRLPGIDSEETRKDDILRRKFSRIFGPDIVHRRPNPFIRPRLLRGNNKPKNPFVRSFPPKWIDQDEEEEEYPDDILAQPVREPVRLEDRIFPVDPITHDSIERFSEKSDSFESSGFIPLKKSIEVFKFQPIKDDSLETTLKHEEEEAVQEGYYVDDPVERTLEEENYNNKVKPVPNAIIITKHDDKSGYTGKLPEQADKITNEGDKQEIFAPVFEVVKDAVEMVVDKKAAVEESNDISSVKSGAIEKLAEQADNIPSEGGTEQANNIPSEGEIIAPVLEAEKDAVETVVDKKATKEESNDIPSVSEGSDTLLDEINVNPKFENIYLRKRSVNHIGRDKRAMKGHLDKP